MRLLAILDRRWMRVTLLLWLCFAAMLITMRWSGIHWFALGDTDDNMRMMQVRDLLKGQGWFDVRQYRLNPPEGFDMHWSRLVDLPIAGLILLGRLFTGGAAAERFAVAVAPLLPLAVAMLSIGAAVRKLIAPLAYLPLFLVLLFAPTMLGMFAPTRIDHHGWQLAALTLLALGLVDEARLRGGLIFGAAMALSFSIGIELIPYLALGGGLLVLRWVIDGQEDARVRGAAFALLPCILLGYYGFAPFSNAANRCDALTPVWLSTLVAVSISIFVLSLTRASHWRTRLVLASVAGGILALGFALVWPHCLGRLEGVSPELKRLWLDNISEARPITKQKPDVVASTSYLPFIGVLGHVLALWQLRANRQRLLQWLPLAVMSLVATALLLFQTRVAAAAQLLALPGAVALLWFLIPRALASKHMLVRVLGVPLVGVTASGALGLILSGQLTETPAIAKNLPSKTPSARSAYAQCTSLPALKPVAQLPRATVFTFVDMGPRLITVTHHNAIAGPYHRNERAILDVYGVFDGNETSAHRIIRKHGASLLLLCMGSPEATIYAQRSPNGFYVQLAKGKVPDWLRPVELPTSSALKLWRVVD